MNRPRPVSPPSDLPEDAKSLWRAAQRQLRDQDTWQDTDAALLESYARAVAIARTARQAAEPEPFVRGSKDQLVAHPGLRVAAEAERDACRYASALLLTPQARKRHEITQKPVAGERIAFLEAIA